MSLALYCRSYTVYKCVEYAWALGLLGVGWCALCNMDKLKGENRE
jgi:hypothetical protein